MTEWWAALSSLGKVFACIAIPATLVLLIQTFVSIIGVSGSDGDADVPDGGITVGAAESYYRKDCLNKKYQCCRYGNTGELLPKR